MTKKKAEGYPANDSEEQALRDRLSAALRDLSKMETAALEFKAERDKALLRLDAALFAMVLMQAAVRKQRDAFNHDHVSLAT